MIDIPRAARSSAIASMLMLIVTGLMFGGITSDLAFRTLVLQALACIFFAIVGTWESPK